VKRTNARQAGLVLLACAGACGSCTGARPAEPTAPAVAPAEAVTSARPVDAAPPPVAVAQDADADVPVEAAAEPSHVFPPPDFPAPQPRTAKEGDGIWVPAPEAGTVDDRPVMFRTIVHPHRYKRFTSVVVVAMDLTRVALNLAAGTQEPKSDVVPADHRSGLVPDREQGRLAAVFNGGFQAKHGEYGMRIGEDTFLPAQDEMCTVGLFPEGRIRIGPWQALAPFDKEMLAYRQTPPCLLVGGQPNALLARPATRRKWGLAVNGRADVRRTALGLDTTGKTLLFALGEELEVNELADAMAAAGAVDAAQLDINWSYTRFLFFGRPREGAPLQVTSTLIPKIKHTKRGYVQTPSTRDFFYVLRVEP
jgi:Phosphodiester glycosidase